MPRLIKSGQCGKQSLHQPDIISTSSGVLTVFEQGHTPHELCLAVDSWWWLYHRPISFPEASFFFLILFVYFWLLCLHCHVWAFSSCGVQASCCGGFSGGGAWPLGCPGSAVVTLGCSEACGIFPDRGSNPCSSRLAGGLPSTYHQGSPRLLRAASDVTLSQLLVKTPAKSLKGVTLKWKQWSKLSGSKADTGCWRKMWKQAFFVLWWWWWVSNTEIFLQSFPLPSSCQSV